MCTFKTKSGNEGIEEFLVDLTSPVKILDLKKQ